MKKIIISSVLLATVLTNSCTSLSECKNITKTETIMMIDISDKKLFQSIRQDITDNVGNFMQKTGLGTIQECQSFKLSVAPVGSREQLDITSESIAISQKNQSIRDQEQQADPSPLVNMLKNRLNEYEKLTNDKEVTSASTIVNTMLKAILQTDVDAESDVLLFTDGVEFNNYINMYRHIPSVDEIPDVINKLIDQEVLNRFKTFQQEGVNPKVIIILKPCTSPVKVNIRDVKAYWMELLKQLKLTNIQFADNLNTINT
ncbi:MAG: hypothetical protein JSS64_07690 [Bacteroidetes bacterium]|nr:hypothetical protein [Bacteroidota bacterium]MCC6290005.1 hypothetical protein [Chitinophagaceae bacterium]